MAEENKSSLDQDVKTIYRSPITKSAMDIPRTKDVLIDHMNAVVYGLMPDALPCIMPAMYACTEQELFTLIGDKDKLVKYINSVLQEQISANGQESEEKVHGIADIRHQALGDLLFERVVDIETELSAQITGMILEMNYDHVQTLLEDPIALEAAVLRARAEYMQLHHPGLLPERHTLGEKIYARVLQLHPEYAAKITGMLLEMEVLTLQKLLEDTTELDECIEKAFKSLANTDSQEDR